MMRSVGRDCLVRSNDAYNCRMTVYPKIAWIRVFAEGTTIVVSILLAFAIDTRWLVSDWFLNRLDAPLDESVGVRVTPQLEGAIAERAFYTQFVVTGLADLRDTQARIIELIAAEQTSGDML